MSTKIFQIFYKTEQQIHLDPNFVPYSNIKNPQPDWREYWIFKEAYRKGLHKEAGYTGFFSWKFNEKTRIDGRRFLDFVNGFDPAEYDVYFINPLPWEPDCFDNTWLQGEYFHKGILDFTQRILTKCGIDIDLREIVHDDQTTAYCNYWVGNECFWDEYMKFTSPVYEYLTEQITSEEMEFLYGDSNYHVTSNYIPFIMERMFSTLLSYNNNIRARKYDYTIEETYRLTLNIYRVVRDNYYWLEGVFNEHKVANKIAHEDVVKKLKSLEQEKIRLQESYNRLHKVRDDLVAEKVTFKEERDRLLAENHKLMEQLEQSAQLMRSIENSRCVRLVRAIRKLPFLRTFRER